MPLVLLAQQNNSTQRRETSSVRAEQRQSTDMSQFSEEKTQREDNPLPPLLSK